MAWGRHVHEALDRHITKGEPLPAELLPYAHLYEFPAGYIAYSEVKLGIDANGQACDFFDDQVWARGVLDILLVSAKQPEMALLIDHKTGKVREDPAELELHALLLKAHQPQLKNIKGWYNWLAYNRMGSVHDLSDTQRTFARLLGRHTMIAQAFKLGAEAFPPKQGPLCGWCPVKQCEYHP